ncbi:MAG: acyltransferase [Candidatus Sericytochromatia bacterium]|nr:acyltransferase [Candidatus Sericytochromatia bacterium]
MAIHRGARFTTRGRLSIGAGSNIDSDAHLDARGGLVIGANVATGPAVMFLTADHAPQSPDFAGRLRPIRIGDRAWLGARATILPGVNVGEGAIVAAGAVVARDVPPHTIVAGVPARVIGQRPGPFDYDLSNGQRPFE